MTIKVVIPARYESVRLPGKPLRLLANKPLIQHVYECAVSANLGEIIVATDDQRIKDCCESFGATVCMTSTEHESGSDRLAEVVRINNWNGETIVVNLQGDEPLTPTSILEQVAFNLVQYPQADIATLATPITTNDEFNDSNVVKVVRDRQDFAMYFSRATIPFQRDGSEPVKNFALRHLGIYAYRAAFLKQFTEMETSPVEQLEKLEQMRALWNGKRIHVDIARAIPGHGVDTEEDLKTVEQQLR